MGATESALSAPKLPIVYDANYNIKLFGLEKLHAFDSCKYEKIVDMLTVWKVITGPNQLTSPGRAVTDTELAQVHSPTYLETLRTSAGVAKACEMAPLSYLPNWIVDSHITTPMKWAVQGTVLAGELAIQNGWAINLGGGMHHASYCQGGGWCLYADVFLSFLQLHKAHPHKIKRMMTVDLDVHEGNGFAHSKSWLATAHKDLQVYMIDGFNPLIYPGSCCARGLVDDTFAITSFTKDDDYIRAVAAALKRAPECDVIYYNAGTDVLMGDPLNGGVGISEQAVIKRDQLVFDYARAKGVPIVMVLSGGYSQQSASVCALSIANIISRHHQNEHKT
jgi:histone deacetylase 11